MKNLYSLFTLSAFSFLFAQNYNPLVNSQNQWKVEFSVSFMAEPDCLGLKINHSYYFTEEIDFNGKTYLTLIKKYDPDALQKWDFIQQNCPNEVDLDHFIGVTETEDILVGYLREDTEDKKVYWIKNGENSETVLYDFSYPIGSNNLGNGYHISTTEVHEFNLQTIKNLYSFQGNYYDETIQGIGSIGDLIIYKPTIYELEGFGFKLLGFSNDNGLTFYNRENQSLQTQDLSQEANSFKIFPNPANDYLSIQTNNVVKQISIYNLNGNKLMNLSNTKTINVSSLSIGTYLISVQFEDGTIHRSKFIKK